MLNFEGNTAPYIQYAYTRIISILKKSIIPVNKLTEKILLKKESEINLAIKILEFEEIVLLIAQKGTPHMMCKYLYQLATCFSNFYENCSTGIFVVVDYEFTNRFIKFKIAEPIWRTILKKF